MELEKYWVDDGGLPLPEWIIDDEAIAIIADCTQHPRASVEDIIDCYCMLLKEAALRGFRITIPNVGYIYNKPESLNHRKLKAGFVDYNRPEFKFFEKFKKEMKEKTEGNLYEFREEGGYIWKADALEELGETGSES